MRREWGAILILLILLVGGSPGGATEGAHFVGKVPSGGDPGSEMLRVLVEHFVPEEATLVMDAPPDGTHTVRHLFLEVVGASAGGFRVARLRLEPSFVTFSPIEDWTSPGGLQVKEIVSAKFDAEITEADLNDFLRKNAFGKGSDEWRDATVDLRPEGLCARVRYASGMVNALVELRTKLQVREGNQICFADYSFSVNGDSQSEGLIREALEKIQPVVDFRDFIFPVKIAFLEMGDDALRVRTRTPPAPFSGMTYTYSAQ